MDTKSLKSPLTEFNQNPDMQLFKKIFQKQRVGHQQQFNIPDAALFVENEPPEQKDRDEAPSGVAAFLNENHFSAGLSAGYNMHCHDGLLFHLIQLRTRFRQYTDYLIVDLSNQISEKEMIPRRASARRR